MATMGATQFPRAAVHVPTFGRQRLLAVAERAIAHEVDDRVVTLAAGREVVSRVVHDDVRAGPAHPRDVARAADGGHLRATRLGDLHGEHPYTARGADDQQRLTGLHVGSTHHIERGAGRDGHRGRLLEREHCRLGRDGVGRDRRVFRECHERLAVHLVPEFHAGDVFAERCHRARHVLSGDAVLGAREPEHQTREVGLAREQDGVSLAHRRGTDLDEYLVVAHLGHGDLLVAEDVRRAVSGRDDRVHRARVLGDPDRL
ncbi:MAG: hypothetical protein WC718_11295 [Phycisphaerales bacterium]|jgi:hypothetical protein